MLFEHIGYLQSEVTRLTNDNLCLKNEVVYLRNRLAKYENPKNSSNSSKPPSSDYPKQQKTQSLREPSEKKPGGQSGHEGTTLKMVSTPDIIEDHSPLYCTCCGEDLSAQPSLFSGKRQVIDIPPITPIVTEHQLFDKRCKCGYLNKASYPMGVRTPVSYGENVQALIAYLSTRQYLPVKRLSEFLSDIFGLSVSTGGVGYILDKMKRKATPTYESIRQNVLKHSVVGADETGVNINGKNHWAWAFQHDGATFIAIHPNRGYKAIEQIMPEGFQNNILVTDCWASYFKTNALSHQICTAHLLRELLYLKDRYKNDTWAERFSLLIIKALGLRKNNNITKANIDHVFNSFSVLNKEPINTVFEELIPFRKRMVKYADFVFNFLLYKEVPPDNNGSERAIRNFKVKLKVSGFFKSPQGAETFAMIRSVIDTAIKNNRNPLLITKLIAQCSGGTE
jgi:transposase